MEINYEESREKVEKVLAGELDPTADELRPLIRYILALIWNGKEYVDKSVALFEKLLHKVDQDEDDEMEMVIEAADGIIGGEGPEVAVYLIKKGADVNVANEKQETPMLLAVEKGMDEVLAFL